MADQISTRFGALDRGTALVVYARVSELVNTGVIMLVPVHLQLSFARSPRVNPPPSPTPADRWHLYKNWLFGGLSEDGLQDTAPTPGPATEWSMTEQEQPVVDKLLAAAGTFLMTEATALHGQIDTWLMIEPAADSRDAGLGRATVMRAILDDVTAVGQDLILRIGEKFVRNDFAEEIALAQAGVSPLPCFDHDTLLSFIRSQGDRGEAVSDIGVMMLHQRAAMLAERMAPLTVLHATVSTGRRATALHLLADAIGDPPPPVMRIAIVIDNLLPEFVNSYAPLVSETILSCWTAATMKYHLVEAMFIAVDGRRSDPVELDVARLTRFSDSTTMIHHLQTFARLPSTEDSHSDPDSNCPSWNKSDHELDRIHDLASALCSATEMSFQEIVLVVGDTPSVGEASSSVEPFDILELERQLQEIDSLPDLSEHHVTVIAPSQPTRTIKALSEICGRVGATVDVRTLDQATSEVKRHRAKMRGISWKKRVYVAVRRCRHRPGHRLRRFERKSTSKTGGGEREEGARTVSSSKTIQRAFAVILCVLLLVGVTRSAGFSMLVAVMSSLALLLSSFSFLLASSSLKMGQIRKWVTQKYWKLVLKSTGVQHIMVSAVLPEGEADRSKGHSSGDPYSGLSIASCAMIVASGKSHTRHH